jgi:antitoxin (DNA-binding transcriptional repressor) of toxin-antitoxin stability system
MEYQYITNKAGTPVAVIVPIQEWEIMQSRLKEEYLTADEIKSAEKGWKEYLDGKGESVEKIAKELLEDTND